MGISSADPDVPIDSASPSVSPRKRRPLLPDGVLHIEVGDLGSQQGVVVVVSSEGKIGRGISQYLHGNHVQSLLQKGRQLRRVHKPLPQIQGFLRPLLHKATVYV